MSRRSPALVMPGSHHQGVGNHKPTTGRPPTARPATWSPGWVMRSLPGSRHGRWWRPTSRTNSAVRRACRRWRCYETLLADGSSALAAVEARSVTPAVERLVEANTLLSGLGFESAGLAVAHSVHNGLTMLGPTHDFLHGEKVAFGLLVQLAVEGPPSSEFHEVVTFCRGGVAHPACRHRSV